MTGANKLVEEADMDASPATLLYRIQQLEKDNYELKQEVKLIEARNEERDRERTQSEIKNLRAGIAFIGSIVTTLLVVIWSYRSVIFRGNP